MIDTHAHYTYKWFDGGFRRLAYRDGVFTVEQSTRDGLLKEMKAEGLTAFIEPAIDIDSNYKARDLYEEYPGFVCLAVGVHPNKTHRAGWARRKELDSLAAMPGVVAIGETGLDFHFSGKHQHRFSQYAWFRYEIRLAHRLGLPLILHVRHAQKEALRVLKRHRKKIVGGVVHCFRGDSDAAESYLSLGFSLGIGGALLKNDERAFMLRNALREIPLERILLETDAPFVLPERPDVNGVTPGKHVRNSSTVIRAVAEEIARLKICTPEEVIAASDANAEALFHLKKVTEKTAEK